MCWSDSHRDLYSDLPWLRDKDSSTAISKNIETITNVEEQQKCAKTLQCSVTFEKRSDDMSDNGEACYYSAQSPTFPNWHLSLLQHKLQQSWNLNSRAAFVLPEDSCSCFYSWSPILLVSKFALSLKTAKGSSAGSLGWFEVVWSVFFSFFYELGAGLQPARGTKPRGSPAKVWLHRVNHFSQKKDRSNMAVFLRILAHCYFCYHGNEIYSAVS